MTLVSEQCKEAKCTRQRLLFELYCTKHLNERNAIMKEPKPTPPTPTTSSEPSNQPDEVDKRLEDILDSFGKNFVLANKHAELATTASGVSDAMKSVDWVKGEAKAALQTLLIEAEATGYANGRRSVSLCYSHTDYDLKMQALKDKGAER